MSLHNPPAHSHAVKAAAKAAAKARFPDGEGPARPGGERRPVYGGRDLGKAVERAAFVAALGSLTAK